MYCILVTGIPAAGKSTIAAELSNHLLFPVVSKDSIKELLFDDDAKSFADAAADAGIPAPDEDYIGLEIEGADGEVVATVEIAWPEQKLGFMTAEQLDDKAVVEQMGWKIIDILSLSEAEDILGGKRA